MTTQRFYSESHSVGLPDKKVVDAVLQACQVLAAVKLLDVGCGDGAFTLLVKEVVRAKEVYGIDISQEAVAKGKERGIECCAVDVDEQDLPFPDGFFDMVYAGAIIEHLVDPDRLLDEIRRVLSPEGVAIAYIPNLAAWYNRLLLLAGYMPQGTEASLRLPNAGKLFKTTELGGGHLRIITLMAFKQLLKNHGFKIVGVKGVAPPVAALPRPLRLAFSALNSVLCRFPSLASAMVVVLTK